MNMFRKALRQLSILGVLFVIPAVLRAGANTWTGGSAIPNGSSTSLVSASPTNPYDVYGTFAGLLHHSVDGGRTWSRIESFIDVTAVLVHPASASTIYVAGNQVDQWGIFVSTDAGETWSPSLRNVYASVLAGSAAEPLTVFAGGNNAIYKTADGGATWNGTDDVTGAISSLVIDSHDQAVAYASGESWSSYYYYGPFYQGTFSKTTDGGATWEDATPESVMSVAAVAVDPLTSSTVYVASVYSYGWAGGVGGYSQLLRSEDGGVSFTPAGDGLPNHTARCLAADPHVAGVVYAGTDSGVYRTRDGGRSWASLGQRLAGVAIDSLVFDGEGRFLHAGTSSGIYDLEIAEGPLDVAAGPAGGSRLLAWNADRASLGTLDASGHFAGGPPGDSSLTWTATAIATAPGSGELTHVLWHNGDGRSSVEVVGSNGRQSAFVFPADPGWMPSDLSVRSDGRTSVLWTSTDGRTRIATVDSSGAATAGPEFGPAPAWAAVAIADGSDGRTRVLWRSADRRSALSIHRDGAMLSSLVWPADPNWTVEDVAIGADGKPRLLRTAPDGAAEVSTVDAYGALTSAATFGSPGMTPRRIAASADGLTRLLFGGVGGVGDLVVLDASNTLSARHAIPASSAATIVVTNAAELEAALVPANAGAQILVRAGDYEVANALTVPDRAILAGEGVMALDTSKLPTEIAAAGRTRFLASADLVGDVLTLGDGSVLRGLVIEDAAGRATGNPVAVVSRAVGDKVAARILECEIVNPNPSGIVPAGPTGRGVVVVARNPNAGQDPAAHAGASLGLQMTRSIVRSPGAGYGVFAINFASHAKIDLDFERNAIGGGLTAAGGVGRPDAVTGSGVRIESRRNLYRSDSPDPSEVGWSLSGGADAPSPAFVSEASTFNALRLRSKDDAIEGFAAGISAVGGRRFSAITAPISSNSVEMKLEGTHMSTTRSDLALVGALSFVDAPTGDDNSVRVQMSQASGSGPSANTYAESVTSSGVDLGTGNRLQITGSPTAFAQANEGIDPIPPAEFFESAD
jgi:photosystem II stability/assembly factor-like uncharacterized protein